jgi:hypothetical protein
MLGVCAARVSAFWGNRAEEEESELGFVLVLLYGARARLVTTPSSGRSPARGKDEHVVVLSSMRPERMRTTPSPLFLDERVRWAGLGRVGLLLMGSC